MNASPTLPPDAEEQVLNALRRVIDPELECNIVDLGLVRAVSLAGGDIALDLTVTTPGCPMTSVIGDGAARVVEALPFTRSVDVRWVFDPPWTPEQMSEAGRRQVGWE